MRTPTVWWKVSGPVTSELLVFVVGANGEAQESKASSSLLSFFLSRPLDVIQFDAPNCSKKIDLMEESLARAAVRRPPGGLGSPIRFIDFLSSPSTSGMHHIQLIMTNVPTKDQQSSN